MQVQTCTVAYLRIYVHIRTHTHVYTYIYICIHIYMYTLACTCPHSFGSHSERLVDRFHGNVGDRYSVECPKSCSMANTRIYGCGIGPYLDDSSICKAAVGLKLIADDRGGVVTFEMVDPIDFYPSCTLHGLNDLDDPSKGTVQVETSKWTW